MMFHCKVFKMAEGKRLKNAFNGFVAVMVTGHLFAATWPVEGPSVVLMAGQTIEIPLHSPEPIAGDLMASGAFSPSDVTFTASPACHLSAHGCTLWVTAAPTSKRYTAIPVVVSQSAAINTPGFALSVIHPGENKPVHAELPVLEFMPLVHSTLKAPEWPVTHALPHAPAPLQRSGSALFYAEVEPHTGPTFAKQAHNDFTPAINGPAYQIVKLTNHGESQPLSVAITGAGANYFSLEPQAASYGANQNCATLNRIAPQASCLVIIKGKVGDPSQAPQQAILTIEGAHHNVASFTLTTTTYVYAAGGFNTLGAASVSGGNLLAQCTAGTCSNALQGSSGNNYASTNFSVGQWINALAVTPAGNLMVGGVFGAIGGATSGASTGMAALFAQCSPGPVAGNACINQINTVNSTTPYAFNNAYIDAITPPTNQTPSVMYLGGDFAQIRSASVTGTGNRMLAKCTYNGTGSNANCSNYFSSSLSANAAISALDYLTNQVNVGGLFTQIAGYPTTPPSSGTTFASCTSSGCSKGMDSNNPNGSILGMTDDGTSLYMCGTFTQIGSYADSNGGYPLVSCTLAATTTCVNALSGANDANGYIEGLAYSGGNLYVGGNFTTIGGATPVSGGKMLAVCSNGTCSNFVTDNNPYATGTDWGGGIFAVAVGNQTTIVAN